MRTDLPSNLKFNDKNIKKEATEENENMNESLSSFDWSNNSGPNSNSGSSLNKSVTSPSIVLKNLTDSPQNKLSRASSTSTVFPLNHSTSLISPNLLEDSLNNKNITSLNSSLNSTSKTINSSSSTLNSTNSSLQHYLITCGKIKQSDEELVQYKFISRHDADGKFIYLDPKLVILFNF